jgi:serine/threonine protein kinase
VTSPSPSEAARALDRLIGTTVDGKYKILDLLGRGGMGAVFRALHLGTDRTVALKVIVPDYAGRSDFLARFEREARACGRLRHPNIVDVTDFGYDDSGDRRIAYLVMEYLDGCSLADVLRDEATLPVAWVVDVLQQAGSAVEEAHRAGILHRDLKPDNIWLEPNRRGGYTVKVLDFGLAKLGSLDVEPSHTLPAHHRTEHGALAATTPANLAEEPTLIREAAGPAADVVTATDGEVTRLRPALSPTRAEDVDEQATAMGSIIGTPAYMSPEQCRGFTLTTRSDVYSLGVIAYRLLGGALPFSGKSDALLHAHIAEAPRPLDGLRPDLPKEATALIMRALAKTPEDRPPSAGAFTEMLAAHAQTHTAFLEEAILMFMKNARAFLSASVIGLSPFLLLGLFGVINALAFVYGIVLVPREYGSALVVAGVLATLGPGILFVQGAVVPAVMQAVVAPLQPIDVKTLRRRFEPRLRLYFRAIAPALGTFFVSGVWVLIMFPLIRSLRPLVRDENTALALLGGLLAIVLPNVPLLVMLLLLARRGSVQAFQFLGAIAVVEGLEGPEALKRGETLAKGNSAMGPIRALLGIIGGASGFFGTVAIAVLGKKFSPEVAVGMIGMLSALAFILLGPFFAAVNALTYLRARRALGEPLDRALAEFERSVLPENHWKLGERERIATLIASGR